MNIVGKNVEHIKFGEGVIVKKYENKIDVDFGIVIRSFIYPMSFEKFLKTTDVETEDTISNDIKLSNKIQQKKDSEKRTRVIRMTTKRKPSSHCAFDIKDGELEQFIETSKMTTGRNNKNTVPKKLNMESVCLLTRKEKGEKESERKIVGLFMTDENFSGEKCMDGIINANENYKIILNRDADPVYFWSIFSEESRKESWGSRKMKYISTSMVKEFVNKIFVTVIDDNDLKREMVEFDRYFSDMCSI